MRFLCGALVVTAVACGQSDRLESRVAPPDASSDVAAQSALGRQRIDARLAEFPGTLTTGEVTDVEPFDPIHARPVVPAASRRGTLKTATATFPVSADGSYRIQDDASGIGATFTLPGASATPLTFSKGLVVYPGALGGADVLERPSAEGTEDFVVFDTRPAVEAFSYEVDVSGVAGLRLVGSSLEFLSSDGAPRLRIAPPYVVDAAGVKASATLTVSGCHYDTSPASPWGRAVTPPGGGTCIVRVSWASPSYPAIVDPGWTATGSLASPRSRHVAVPLAGGKVIVMGGGLATTEIYDPTTGTFASSGSLPAGRDELGVATLASGKILVAGGSLAASGATTSTAYLYDPALGTFAATGSMTVERKSATVTTLKSGKVLVAGGDTNTGITASAELYDPTTGTFSSTGPMQAARDMHTATLLGSGKVLVEGGVNGGVSLNGELYDPTAGTFSNTGAESSFRNGQTATLLPSGKVLITGGATLSDATADIYDPVAGTFSTVGPMTSAHSDHSAALLLSGKVLIVGGSPTADLFDPATSTFAATGNLVVNRKLASVTSLPLGTALVAGGLNSGLLLNSAELYGDLADGVACVANVECHSNACVDGVCCNASCDGQCEACNVPGQLGICSPITGAPRGTRKACTGSGTCAGVCNGKDADGCIYPAAACGSTCNAGQETDSVCDGAGACAPHAPISCNNLICANDTKCKSSCASNADCLEGFTCDPKGACVSGGVCTDDHSSKGAGGTTSDCSPYKCGSDGLCITKCKTVDDCIGSNVCSTEGTCVPVSNESSDGCSVAEDSSDGANSSGTLVIVGATALFVAARRRRS